MKSQQDKQKSNVRPPRFPSGYNLQSPDIQAHIKCGFTTLKNSVETVAHCLEEKTISKNRVIADSILANGMFCLTGLTVPITLPLIKQGLQRKSFAVMEVLWQTLRKLFTSTKSTHSSASLSRRSGASRPSSTTARKSDSQFD